METNKILHNPLHKMFANKCLCEECNPINKAEKLNIIDQNATFNNNAEQPNI